MLLTHHQVEHLARTCGFEKTDFRTGEKRKHFPQFDALFHDRDGKDYPAHKDFISRHHEIHQPLCWVDPHYRVKLFLPFDGDGRALGYFTIYNDDAGNQIQERVQRTQFEQLKDGLREMLCLTLNPQMAGLQGQQPVEQDMPFAMAFKIPVTHLIVDFGDPMNGPRLITIRNARPASYCLSGPMHGRLPSFSDHTFEIDQSSRPFAKDVGEIRPLQPQHTEPGLPPIDRRELDERDARIRELEARAAKAEADAKEALAIAEEATKSAESQRNKKQK